MIAALTKKIHLPGTSIKKFMGHAFMTMPLIAGLALLWSIKTAEPQKQNNVPLSLFAKTMTDLDARLEGLETAIMGLQTKNQRAVNALKNVQNSVGASRQNMVQIFAMLEQINQKTRKPVKVRKAIKKAPQKKIAQKAKRPNFVDALRSGKLP